VFYSQDYISSQLVGSIVGMQSEEIKQMAEEYEGKRAGLVGTDGVRVLGAQAHQRMMASMRKELNTKEKRIEELSERHADLKASYEEAQNKLVTAQTRAGKIMEAIDKLDAMVTDENRE
jgi:predicted nuclease with TOPRIM domain